MLTLCARRGVVPHQVLGQYVCLFFAAMTLLCAGTSKLGARTHRGFWFLKAFVVFALLVSTLFISNETLVGYREAARYLSFPFLLVQLLLVIDFAYTWNEKCGCDVVCCGNSWTSG